MSSQMSEEDIGHEIELRRMNMLDRLFYNIAWNKREKMKEKDVESWQMVKTEIQQCIILSKFNRKQFNEKFYKKKLS